MFDFISDIFVKLSANVYWDVVFIVILIGFGQGHYLRSWVWSKDGKLDGAWKTAAISLVLVPLYLTVARNEGNVVLASRAILSYVLATSAYELFIRYIKVLLKQKELDIPPASERPPDYPKTDPKQNLHGSNAD